MGYVSGDVFTDGEPVAVATTTFLTPDCSTLPLQRVLTGGFVLDYKGTRDKHDREVVSRMLTRTQILRAESIRNAQVQEIHQTFAKRRESEAAWQAWENACRTAHATVIATDYLWDLETHRKMREGDRETIGDVLLFLEVDPWHFRSGYLKEHLLDNLKKAPLTEGDKERIRQIIVNVAGGRNRREFRRFCKLAVRVASDEFVEMVEQMARERGRGSGGKFAYLLQYLREHRT